MWKFNTIISKQRMVQYQTHTACLVYNAHWMKTNEYFWGRGGHQDITLAYSVEGGRCIVLTCSFDKRYLMRWKTRKTTMEMFLNVKKCLRVCLLGIFLTECEGWVCNVIQPLQDWSLRVNNHSSLTRKIS